MRKPKVRKPVTRAERNAMVARGCRDAISEKKEVRRKISGAKAAIKGYWAGRKIRRACYLAMQRTHWKCEQCGASYVTLKCVHKKPKFEYPNLQYMPDNLMPLCPTCISERGPLL